MNAKPDGKTRKSLKSMQKTEDIFHNERSWSDSTETFE